MGTLSSFYISGTYGGLTFYVVNGRQLVRSKTSINKKRFFTDPAFAKQRQYSQWLAIASPVASQIYRQLPPQKGLQQRMTGLLITWLKQGISLAAAAQRLIQLWFPQPVATQQQNAAAPTLFTNLTSLYKNAIHLPFVPSIANKAKIPLRI
jgi:hypothetical protein